ncbi:MAG: putative toxin-antitoxin system toxin component, PIN family [Nitrospirota bacterium]|nr:putative toxin-antitoxin system toxin component, PIN family [Nitrospirota bacterium]
MFIVLDTNIIVSALITPFGNAARILDMVISGDINLLYDDRILSEYREVLLREKFGFKEYDVDVLLEYIETEGHRITSAVTDEPLPDNDDVPFLEVALSGRADALVTGNKRHFKVKSARGLKILSPEEFLKLLKQWNKLK